MCGLGAAPCAARRRALGGHQPGAVALASGGLTLRAPHGASLRLGEAGPFFITWDCLHVFSPGGFLMAYCVPDTELLGRCVGD